MHYLLYVILIIIDLFSFWSFIVLISCFTCELLEDLSCVNLRLILLQRFRYVLSAADNVDSKSSVG